MGGLNVDLSEFSALARAKGPRCTLERPALKPADLEKLKAALAAPSITSVAIARWLEDHGIELTSYVVQRHRRGDCRCGRAGK